MAYDPRSAALADGLFTQRFGKTVLVVADDAARDALDPAVTPVAITASDDLLNIYDADASAWTKIGKETVITVPAVADLANITNPEEIKLAIVDATSEIYRYNGTAWVLCAGGGGGGSGLIATAVTADAVLAANMYAMVDTSAGPVVLTMPEAPAVGTELAILDAMRTFGQAGHECTLSSPNTMIEGSTEAVDLNVEGKEYKFRFVGGTMGWRML